MHTHTHILVYVRIGKKFALLSSKRKKRFIRKYFTTYNALNTNILSMERNNTNYIEIMKRFEVGHRTDISDRKRFSFYAIRITCGMIG